MARTVGLSAAITCHGCSRGWAVLARLSYTPGAARSRIGCALIIPMIIQTIGLEPSRSTPSIRPVIGRSSVRIRPRALT
jgi:hypothetical protein